jgi:anti-sigma factor RsiW
MTHLTEEQLNLYLDNALSPAEHAGVEAHLAECETCQAELAALQTLFTALNTLQPEALATDLTPMVLENIAAERQRIVRRRLGWLVPGLQGLAIILLLLFGCPVLFGRYVELIQRVPTASLYAMWTNTQAQGTILWQTTIAQGQTWWAETVSNFLNLPDTLKQSSHTWPKFPGLGLTTPQIAIIGLAAVLMWLIGNSILLRAAVTRPKLNRHTNH